MHIIGNYLAIFNYLIFTNNFNTQVLLKKKYVKTVMHYHFLSSISFIIKIRVTKIS